MYHWVEEIGRVRRDGRRVHVVGMTRDIDDQIATEEQLCRYRADGGHDRHRDHDPPARRPRRPTVAGARVGEPRRHRGRLMSGDGPPTRRHLPGLFETADRISASVW
ncbi:MAG: hypothetical protein R2713_18785 [Ilumatobacteraceae bacterium]